MAPGLGAGHEVRAGDECSEGGAMPTGSITASCFVYPSRGCRKAAVLGPTSCTAKGFACPSLPVGHPLPWWGIEISVPWTTHYVVWRQPGELVFTLRTAPMIIPQKAPQINSLFNFLKVQLHFFIIFFFHFLDS